MGTATWIGIVVGFLLVAATMIKVLGSKKKGGEAIGWLDVALAFAQGIDDAKKVLPADAKKQLGETLKKTAEEAGKHGDVEEFLKRFGFNRPPDPS
jgi:hypothetical protein